MRRLLGFVPGAIPLGLAPFLVRVPGALVAREGAEHQIDAFADQFGFGVGMAVWGQVLDELFHDLEPEFLVGHFPAAEPERDLYLHFLTQEIDGAARLDAEIVRVNGRAELDFLDLVGVLVFPGFLFLLRLFVAELAVIDQAADGRRCVGRDFNQVHSLGARQVDRFAKLQDAKLLAILCDDPDFAGADFPVYPDE